MQAHIDFSIDRVPVDRWTMLTAFHTESCEPFQNTVVSHSASSPQFMYMAVRGLKIAVKISLQSCRGCTSPISPNMLLFAWTASTKLMIMDDALGAPQPCALQVIACVEVAILIVLALCRLLLSRDNPTKIPYGTRLSCAQLPKRGVGWPAGPFAWGGPP